MTTIGVVSLTAGRGAVRVRGATRDIFAAIRQARSVALVTQEPAIITYSVEEKDGEPIARVVITSTKLFNAPLDRSKVRTLWGESLPAVPTSSTAIEVSTNSTDSSSTLVEDVLFAPISDEVVTGMRLKVVMGDADLTQTAAPRKSKISLFSNVDYLLGKFQSAQQKKAAEEKAKATEESETVAASLDDHQDPVSVVWETNGRVDPHRVYIYADGQRPEDGLSIRIDSFGAAKVLGANGEERD